MLYRTSFIKYETRENKPTQPNTNPKSNIFIQRYSVQARHVRNVRFRVDDCITGKTNAAREPRAHPHRGHNLLSRQQLHVGTHSTEVGKLPVDICRLGFCGHENGPELSQLTRRIWEYLLQRDKCTDEICGECATQSQLRNCMMIVGG